MPPPPRRALRALARRRRRTACLGRSRRARRRALGGRVAASRPSGHAPGSPGTAAHSLLPLERRPSAGFGLALTVLGHAVGWPFARGGSRRLADALAQRVRELGGTLVIGSPVDELPPDGSYSLTCRRASSSGSRAAACPAATSGGCAATATARARSRSTGRSTARSRGAPRSAARAGDGPPGRHARRALARRSGARGAGAAAERPFVLLAQQTPLRRRRARRPGKQTRLGLLPRPERLDRATRPSAIEAQVERFAPGFRELILARNTIGPARRSRRATETWSAATSNGGAMDLGQLVRAAGARAVPYGTPLEGVYLCSAVDAARRRRPRDVRPLGGARGAAAT